ncbi:collagen alpha-1(I) chain-like [Sciurus carolinensis]|uniref:collagen alpha-1(I) chain-like n=1 Tax=Sciurus carolinensis TaxID=30640 RepID=UPI001FB320AB|nr:collagen alpha-1(I) chain-like [Sciurus carolinensis]
MTVEQQEGQGRNGKEQGRVRGGLRNWPSRAARADQQSPARASSPGLDFGGAREVGTVLTATAGESDRPPGPRKAQGWRTRPRATARGRVPGSHGCQDSPRRRGCRAQSTRHEAGARPPATARGLLLTGAHSHSASGSHPGPPPAQRQHPSSRQPARRPRRPLRTPGLEFLPQRHSPGHTQGQLRTPPLEMSSDRHVPSPRGPVHLHCQLTSPSPSQGQFGSPSRPAPAGGSGPAWPVPAPRLLPAVRAGTRSGLGQAGGREDSGAQGAAAGPRSRRRASARRDHRASPGSPRLSSGPRPPPRHPRASRPPPARPREPPPGPESSSGGAAASPRSPASHGPPGTRSPPPRARRNPSRLPIRPPVHDPGPRCGATRHPRDGAASGAPGPDPAPPGGARGRRAAARRDPQNLPPPRCAAAGSARYRAPRAPSPAQGQPVRLRALGPRPRARPRHPSRPPAPAAAARHPRGAPGPSRRRPGALTSEPRGRECAGGGRRAAGGGAGRARTCPAAAQPGIPGGLALSARPRAGWAGGSAPAPGALASAPGVALRGGRTGGAPRPHLHLLRRRGGRCDSRLRHLRPLPGAPHRPEARPEPRKTRRGAAAARSGGRSRVGIEGVPNVCQVLNWATQDQPARGQSAVKEAEEPGAAELKVQTQVKMHRGKVRPGCSLPPPRAPGCLRPDLEEGDGSSRLALRPWDTGEAPPPASVSRPGPAACAALRFILLRPQGFQGGFCGRPRLPTPSSQRGPAPARGPRGPGETPRGPAAGRALARVRPAGSLRPRLRGGQPRPPPCCVAPAGVCPLWARLEPQRGQPLGGHLGPAPASPGPSLGEPRRVRALRSPGRGPRGRRCSVAPRVPAPARESPGGRKGQRRLAETARDVRASPTPPPPEARGGRRSRRGRGRGRGASGVPQPEPAAGRRRRDSPRTGFSLVPSPPPAPPERQLLGRQMRQINPPSWSLGELTAYRLGAEGSSRGPFLSSNFFLALRRRRRCGATGAQRG